MKESENTGGREGSGGAESNTPAVTPDPSTELQLKGAKELLPVKEACLTMSCVHKAQIRAQGHND